MRDPTLESPSGILTFEQTVDKARGKRIPTPHPIQDLDLAERHLPKLVPTGAHGAPAVSGGGGGLAQRRRHQRQIREGLPHASYHAPEAFHIELAEIFGPTVELEAERGRKILLVAEQHVYVRHECAVHLARLGLAADVAPERGTIVEVVR